MREQHGFRAERSYYICEIFELIFAALRNNDVLLFIFFIKINKLHR